MKALPISDPRWLRFINNHPDATIFHHPAWSNLLKACYGYQPVTLVILDETGEIASGLPLMQVDSWLTGQRMVSLPFSDFCQPLLSKTTEPTEFPGSLYDWWRNHDKLHTQIRWPLPDHQEIFAGQSYVQHINQLLPDPDKVRRAFKPKISQFIRQAERANITIRQSCDWQDMQIYYRLHLLTRKRQGVPAQPFRYFRLFWQKVIAQGLGFILLAFHGTQPIAGAVFLHWNQSLIYKYGASDPAYWTMRPNHLLFWHVIRWGCEQNYQTLDWGRTDLEQEGLRDFKRSWGGQERIMRYSVLSQSPYAPEITSASNQRILKGLIQHSPPWVCKTIGTLLYGHFA